MNRKQNYEDFDAALIKRKRLHLSSHEETRASEGHEIRKGKYSVLLTVREEQFTKWQIWTNGKRCGLLSCPLDSLFQSVFQSEKGHDWHHHRNLRWKECLKWTVLSLISASSFDSVVSSYTDILCPLFDPSFFFRDDDHHHDLCYAHVLLQVSNVREESPSSSLLLQFDSRSQESHTTSQEASQTTTSHLLYLRSRFHNHHRLKLRGRESPSAPPFRVSSEVSRNSRRASMKLLFSRTKKAPKTFISCIIVNKWAVCSRISQVTSTRSSQFFI